MLNLDLKDVVTNALEDIKAIEIQCLDVSTQSDFADFMFVVSGSSSRHVKSIAQTVIEQSKEAGFRPLGVEGLDQGDWVLIDLTDIVVHVMLPKTREFYDIERLWSVTSTNSGKTLAE
jgi:ribosome-associated protein